MQCTCRSDTTMQTSVSGGPMSHGCPSCHPQPLVTLCNVCRSARCGSQRCSLLTRHAARLSVGTLDRILSRSPAPSAGSMCALSCVVFEIAVQLVKPICSAIQDHIVDVGDASAGGCNHHMRREELHDALPPAVHPQRRRVPHHPRGGEPFLPPTGHSQEAQSWPGHMC